MKYPGRLEITTRIGCRCMCAYCPQELLIAAYFNRGNENKPDQVMSVDTFRKCIGKLPAGTRIDFSGMAEPWLNPDCTEMLLYAFERGFPIAVYSTLEGMKQEDFDLIKEIPYEEFVIHIPDDQGNAHIHVTEAYIALLEQAMTYEQNDGRKLMTGISCHAGIHPALKDAVPKDSRIITEIHNRAGNVKNIHADSKVSSGIILCLNCGTHLHHNVLLPDGTVLLCCMDYGMKHIIGNLISQTYEEIHHSKEAQAVRSGMSEPTSGILCRDCVNARNIEEMYDEYVLFRDWTQKLLHTEETYKKELGNYKDWVKCLEDQIKETENEYKNWVANLQEQAESKKQKNGWSQDKINEMQERIAYLADKNNQLQKELESMAKSPFYKLVLWTKDSDDHITD